MERTEARPKVMAGVRVTMMKGKDIRNVLEGHTTERGGNSRRRGVLFGVVFVVDNIEMDSREFSVPEQNFRV